MLGSLRASPFPDVKKLLLTSLFALVCGATAHAQQIKAPESLLPSPLSPTPAAKPQPQTDTQVEKMAEEAQKSLFNAVDKGSSGAPSAPVTEPATGGVPYLVPGGSMRLPSPVADSPTLWAKDSVHKIAVLDIAFGGSRESVTIELFPNDAPQTVANFINKAESGVYNGLAFHRAIEGFLVQTGDPLTADESARERWGTGGEDQTLPAEIKRPHRIGSVAMARRADKVNPDRRSNSSQFYVALGNFASLDGKYTVFGQVVSGLETIQTIAAMPVDSNDCPIARIELKSVKIQDHKGPLQVQQTLASDGTSTGGQRYVKPASSRGMVGRFLHRVW